MGIVHGMENSIGIVAGLKQSWFTMGNCTWGGKSISAINLCVTILKKKEDDSDPTEAIALLY